MNILIVEDDRNKRNQLAQFIQSTYPAWAFTVAKSYNSALKAIVKSPPDLILLDMSMPTYDVSKVEEGGRPQHYAGREILRQMNRRGIAAHVIVVTAFDVFGEGSDAMTRAQLDLQLKKDHLQNYRGTIYYDASVDQWKADLQAAIASLAGGAGC